MPDTSRLTGRMLIADSPVRGSGTPIRAFNPTTGQELEPAYPYGDQSHVDAACSAAAAAFAVYRSTTSQQRAEFLEAIAVNIEVIGVDIIARAVAESGLPEARITGGARSAVPRASCACSSPALPRLLRDGLPQREWTTDDLVEDVLA
jgi:2,5-dioxopentanoate dehydrogenase